MGGRTGVTLRDGAEPATRGVGPAWAYPQRQVRRAQPEKHVEHTGLNAADGPRVSRSVIHKGRKFDFEFCRVLGGDGTQDREVVRHPGAVVILPVLETPQGPMVVLIRNWRIALEAWSLELPAGTMEPPEPAHACAARELMEETGYRAATLTHIGRFNTSPGLSDELMEAYLATGLSPVGGQRLEADERIQVEPTSVARCWELIASGALMDAKSMLTLLLAQRLGVLAR